MSEDFDGQMYDSDENEAGTFNNYKTINAQHLWWEAGSSGCLIGIL